MRYPQIQTFQQVLAADPNVPVIKLQATNGKIYLSIISATEVRPSGKDSTEDVTAINFQFGTEMTQDVFDSSFPQELNIETKDAVLDGGAITVDSKDYGTYTDNVPLIIDPNEMLLDSSTNVVYVEIVNGADIDNFFGTWGTHK